MSAPIPAPYPAAPTGARPAGKRRGPWVVWILSYVTAGIYLAVWYGKLNNELKRFAPEVVSVTGGLAGLAMFVPIVNWVSLARTAGRLNAAHAAVGSPVRVSAGMAILSSLWVFSQTRYLQRRANLLWDAVGAP